MADVGNVDVARHDVEIAPDRLVGFDASTGDRLWQRDLDVGCEPAAWTGAGLVVVPACGSSGRVRFLDGGSGADRADWSAPVADPELDQLTNREREVLRLLARGYAYKEIAKELFISIKTVETHVSNVLRKLQMSNRYELSRWAADRRLV